MATTRDIRNDMVTQIVSAMEAGKLDWTRPWANPMNPYNFGTGSKYHGMNVLRLWITSEFILHTTDNRWMTFNQCRQKGWHVRKGETGTKVLWFTMKKVGEDDPNTGLQPDGSYIISNRDKSYPVAKAFTVFNGSQIEGIDPLGEYDDSRESERCEQIIANCGVSIEYGGSEAVYNASKDIIKMPDRVAFTSTGAFYATILHEIAHSTGHKTRLDRNLEGDHSTDSYAYEELVAEMASAFVMGEIRLDVDDDEMQEHIKQHAAYVQSWLTTAKKDANTLVKAIADADRAANLILSYCDQEDNKDDVEDAA